ncbi:NUDIX hydrolase [Paraburkholderia strydomiana]|uniref:NUDIX hydrolase n=1 Tax=Paraburkholderia strydomiana TaxID=1245417 RepID=UPI0028545B8B|nr:NUDIX domain-containing protein [Paraburkholderia strydomiana]MDR7006635.1 8-oxo-dGTP pyrophosphatase MutT (NUDIX family) [Paraburkholderia strydomiana]
MISFDTGSHRFNLRAAAVIFQDEYVLLHQVEGDDFWCLPGGRVEPDEHAAQTVVREMHEEIGASVQIEKTLCVVENFFTHNGRTNHEIGLYLVARLESGSPLLDLAVSHHGSEGNKRLTFSWVSRQRLSEIEVRPTFLRQLLQAEHIALAHVIQRESHFEISY